MNNIKKILSLPRRRPIVFGVIPIAIVLIILIVAFTGGNAVENTITVEKKTFVQKLSVSGTVESNESANLGFAQSGRISKIYVKVGDTVKKGDTLATIENNDLYASLLQRQSVLEKERANLATKEQGTRPEELKITQQKYDDAVSDYVDALHTAYLKVEEALISNSDTLFDYGSSFNPRLNISLNDSKSEDLSENTRVEITQNLAEWNAIMINLYSANKTSDSISTAKLISKKTIDNAKTLMRLLSLNVDYLASNVGTDQSEVSVYRTDINDASMLVSAASETLNSSQSALNLASNSLSLDVAGSTRNEIQAQQSVVKAAEADVLSAQAQLAKTIIQAPFDGIVTKIDIKVGEVAGSNSSSVSMIGNGSFLVKSNVPEVYISNLNVGNTATATLDAYGPSVSFALKVIAIDPAETVVNGVSNYKTTLQFLETDRVIRSGMTANVDIVTEEIQDAFVIPIGSVFKRDGKQYIQVKVNGENVEREVVLGSSTIIGEVNVVSGLTEGDVIVLSPVIK